MSRKCKAFAHLDDAYYPEHNCITTGTPTESLCEECLMFEELPRLQAALATLTAELEARTMERDEAQCASALARRKCDEVNAELAALRVEASCICKRIPSNDWHLKNCPVSLGKI